MFVTHRHHNCREGKTKAIKGQQIKFAVVQGTASGLLGLDQDVVVQVVGQGLQIGPIVALIALLGQGHGFPKLDGKILAVILIRQFHQLLHGVNLLVNDGTQLVAMVVLAIVGLLTVAEQSLHLFSFVNESSRSAFSISASFCFIFNRLR